MQINEVCFLGIGAYEIRKPCLSASSLHCELDFTFVTSNFEFAWFMCSI